MDFLRSFRVDDDARNVSLSLISAYIDRLTGAGELVSWTVAVRGLQKRIRKLGAADWGLPNGPIAQISRSRLGETDSLGVIVDPEDEAIGLSTTERGRNARGLRSAEQGLLLLYPISRYSGYDIQEGGNRRPLFDNPDGPSARDLVGWAISFPRSNQPERIEAFLEGTAGWRPVE